MRQISALREDWHVKQIERTPDIVALCREAAAPGACWLTASMPAQVHDVLFAHGRIPDPHNSMNAAACAWVGEQDWAYACSFRTPPAGDGPIFLRFNGLDTLATVYLNGHEAARYDNMFRTFELDARPYLAPAGEANTLLIHFASPLRAIAAIQQPPEHVGVINRPNYLRKPTSDYHVYLGAAPHFVKIGVFDDVLLDVPDAAWLDDVWVRTMLAPDRASATVRVSVSTRGAAEQIRWVLADPGGARVAGGVAAPGAAIEIGVEQPQLWWPHTYGPSPLYTLTVQAFACGRACDECVRRVGLRDVRLELEDPATGEARFRFIVNGRPVYLQGGLWAPVEGMTHCWPAERAARLIDLALMARMDTFRVWGGANVFGDSFYDACDEKGILIWQDFMFDYGASPDDDPPTSPTCAPRWRAWCAGCATTPPC
jgi:beta-mannosidase